MHVDRQIRQTRDRRRPEQHHCAHKREGDTCTCRSAEYPQDEALCQQLCDQLAPTRAEGSPYGNLATTSLPPREQQIRYVRTGDEKHERDGAEKGHQRGANAANKPLERHGVLQAGQYLHPLAPRAPGARSRGFKMSGCQNSAVAGNLRAAGATPTIVT